MEESQRGQYEQVSSFNLSIGARVDLVGRPKCLVLENDRLRFRLFWIACEECGLVFFS
jgi:hypothetical protein